MGRPSPRVLASCPWYIKQLGCRRPLIPRQNPVDDELALSETPNDQHFGAQVRAKVVTTGGDNGHATSRHFNDQALRYSTGDLRDVYFLPFTASRPYRAGSNGSTKSLQRRAIRTWWI